MGRRVQLSFHNDLARLTKRHVEISVVRAGQEPQDQCCTCGGLGFLPDEIIFGENFIQEQLAKPESALYTTKGLTAPCRVGPTWPAMFKLPAGAELRIRAWIFPNFWVLHCVEIPAHKYSGIYRHTLSQMYTRLDGKYLVREYHYPDVGDNGCCVEVQAASEKFHGADIDLPSCPECNADGSGQHVQERCKRCEKGYVPLRFDTRQFPQDAQAFTTASLTGHDSRVAYVDRKRDGLTWSFISLNDLMQAEKALQKEMDEHLKELDVSLRRGWI